MDTRSGIVFSILFNRDVTYIPVKIHEIHSPSSLNVLIIAHVYFQFVT